MEETADLQMGITDDEPIGAKGGRGDDDVERILEAHDLAARQLERVLSSVARAEASLSAEEQRRVEENAGVDQLRPLRSARLALDEARNRLAPVVSMAETHRDTFEREWFEVEEDRS
jgi:hypothetical protein